MVAFARRSSWEVHRIPEICPSPSQMLSVLSFPFPLPLSLPTSSSLHPSFPLPPSLVIFCSFGNWTQSFVHSAKRGLCGRKCLCDTTLSDVACQPLFLDNCIDITRSVRPSNPQGAQLHSSQLWRLESTGSRNEQISTQFCPFLRWPLTCQKVKRQIILIIIILII